MTKENNDRFVLVHENRVKGTTVTAAVIVDRMTGVQYLMNNSANGKGMTILSDQDGKPLLYNPTAENG